MVLVCLVLGFDAGEAVDAASARLRQVFSRQRLSRCAHRVELVGFGAVSARRSVDLDDPFLVFEQKGRQASAEAAGALDRQTRRFGACSLAKAAFSDTRKASVASSVAARRRRIALRSTSVAPSPERSLAALADGKANRK